MIPPTSIDGTDITGATIDGTDVQEITVDGDVVFTAGPAIIDDFEDGNLNEYNGDTSNWPINTFDGSLALAADGSGNEIYSTSGLANYPQRGDTVSYDIGIDSNPNWSRIHIGGDGRIANDTYAFEHFGGGPRSRGTLFKYSNGSRTAQIDTFDFKSLPDDSLFTFTIEFATNGDIIWTGPDGNVETTNDTDYTLGAIGFSNSPLTNNYFDNVKIL